MLLDSVIANSVFTGDLILGSHGLVCLHGASFGTLFLVVVSEAGLLLLSSELGPWMGRFLFVSVQILSFALFV